MTLAVATRAVQSGSRIALAAETELKPSMLPLRIGDEERSLPVRELRHPREVAMVRSAYARAALRQLLLSMASDDELLEHGRRFQQLTPRTSLLVLESWRDYEEWNIPLPDDVRLEKERDLRQTAAVERQQADGETRPAVIEPPSPAARAAERSRGSGEWMLDGVAMTGGDALPGVTVQLTAGAESRTAVTDGNGRFTFRLPRAPSSFRVRAELPGLRPVTYVSESRIASGSTIRLDLKILAVAEAITVTASAPALAATTSASASFITAPLRHGSAADAALADRLFGDAESVVADETTLAELVKRRREVIAAVTAKMAAINSVEERVRYYVTSRSMLGGDKAFHLQAATLFQHDAPALASRILSDLAEAYPDDSALLRILARIFEGWEQPDIARLLLYHALDVAANEPQSWREAMLSEARLGNAAAIETLVAAIAAGDREIRAEVGAAIEPLLARWRALPESVRNAPHDLRLQDDAALQVDLMWDTNHSDVDLYVTEPGGETVMYTRMRSAQGGRLHEDVTDGYGPEIYTIAEPRPGEYQIAIDYYAVDDTDIGIETLAHLVVYNRSRSGVDRRELILLLTGAKERRVVTTVNVTR